MTLGIGVICERGECVVAASDQRATYGNSPVGPNDECGKQFYMGPLRCFGLVAGSMSSCHAVYSQIMHLIDKCDTKDALSRELFMQFIDDARFRELRKVYDWELKRRVGFSLKEWATGKIHGTRMHKLIVDCGLTILNSVPFKVELIIAGYVGDVGMFFRACQKGKLEEETSPGVYAIGSGQVDAMRQLNMRGQHTHMSLARTLLHVYEAMYISQSKFVGPPPEMIGVIRKREPRILKFPLSMLEEWRRIYEKKRTTATLDDSKVAAMQVYARLKVAETSDLGR